MLRDITGIAEDSLELPGTPTLGAVWDQYAQRFPRLHEIASSIVPARNQHFSNRSAPLGDGDEVAFLPPVSGGAGTSSAPPYVQSIVDEQTGHFFGLTREPIDCGSLARQLLRGEDGAVVQFEGVVRNNTKGRPTKFLDYECYEPMAVQVMASIGRELAATLAIGRIAMVHRLGRMQIGEASVAVIVTAPHRRPAFEAALEGINRLKRLVPIWKKEYFADGEVWVEGEWDESVLGR